MKFISTRNSENVVNFSEALFQGLAEDGGLFVPQEQADLKHVFDNFTDKTSFTEIASKMISSLLSDTFSPSQADELAVKAFPFSPKMINLKKGISILELFHGHSCAFKDFGASFLAHSMEMLLEQKDSKAVILTATSGDTGSAVAQAFVDKENIDVVILYPSGRVSPLQEKQLTTIGSNIKALEVKGSFDDCQRMVKDAFINSEITGKINLSSANSINLGRLIPQSFYYVWACSQLKNNGSDPIFTVPSGNFGNMTAGLYAQSWGLPVSKFIAATNANDVIPKYLKEGVFKSKPSIHTISNAMDVGSPSNYERMAHLFQNNVENFRKLISADSVSDEETREIIKNVYDDLNYIMCPHTAVGYGVAERYIDNHKNIKNPVLVLSTAHPGKFTEVIEDVLHIQPQLPKALLELQNREKVSTVIENSNEALRDFLLTTY